jgi:flavin reductase (DIM6/NTAB) family NADH-FMN oxidoreductase RutF
MTLAYPLPVHLIGSYAPDGRPNVMTAAWSGVVCSEPPCLAVGIRTSRLTYEGIMANQAFTVNYPTAKLAKIVDYIGLVSGRDHDKFAETGLTPAAGTAVKAPYVDQCPVIAQCRVIKSLELGTHTLFVGEIVDILADEGLKNSQGGLDFVKLDALAFISGQYHQVGNKIGQAFSIGLDFKK